MAFWLFKSEPGTWSWDDQVADGVAEWDGVRNNAANKNMKQMAVGDRGFFYHSNRDKAIVGIVEVVREHYPDPSDETGRFGMVDVKTVRSLPRPVTLKEIKADPRLQDMALVRQSRLSVQPVKDDEWLRVCELAGLTE